MQFQEQLNEVNEILDGPIGKDSDVWTMDHGIWFSAWLMNEFGESVLSGMLIEEDGKGPKVTPDEAAEKMSYFLRPPGFVVDTPFPDTWEMWWESVSDLMNSGKIVAEGGKPNYEGAVRGWKNRIKERYGFRPARTKEHSMKEHIEQMVSGAAKVISSKRRGMHLPKELISKAAKLLQGRGIQRKRKKEYDRLQAALDPNKETA